MGAQSPIFLQSYKEGDPISGLMKPTLEEYDFKGWKETITVMPAKDLYLTPIWLPTQKDDS